MRPNDFAEAVADMLVATCHHVFREEPLTAEEWDVLTDRILRLAEAEKAKIRETRPRERRKPGETK